MAIPSTSREKNGCKICGNSHRTYRSKKFQAVELNEWDCIHAFSFKEDKRNEWIYRGQQDATQPLETTLERAFEGFKANSKKNIQTIENEIIREFKRCYHQYAKHLPSDSDNMEWLSIMRHHGAPVRLLDFTYSIYVAAYFALEHHENRSKKVDNSKCVIWAINLRWLSNTVRKMLKLKKKKADELKKERDKKILNPRNRILCVSRANPFRLTERLTLQQGVFLCANNIEYSFQANLEYMKGFDEKKNILKIVIPKEIRNDALKSLKRMNISRAILFPGLDGFAQSLNVTEVPPYA